MTIIDDQIRRIDGHLDQLYLWPSTLQDESLEQTIDITSSPRIIRLQNIAKALSATTSNPVLSPARLSRLLKEAALPVIHAGSVEQDPIGLYEAELYWLLVSKATVHVYGLLLNTLLEQTTPLIDEIWYWDEILGSYTYSSLFTIQTSPIRFYSWLKDIFHNSLSRLAGARELPESHSVLDERPDYLAPWRKFYRIVQHSIREKSLSDLQHRVLSPLALCRSQARQNQVRLKQSREIAASRLGMLMEEALSFQIKDDRSEPSESDRAQWKMILEQSVTFMDTMLKNFPSSSVTVSEFENQIFAIVENDTEIGANEEEYIQIARIVKISMKLEDIIHVQVPNYVAWSHRIVRKYGRPSRITRYWLPICALFLSSTTLLKLFVDWKVEISELIRNFGQTTRDFWLNWILEPTKRVIGTIRHDPNSEFAFISKESLSGDRDSLERMVIQFVIDNPHMVGGEAPLDEAQISQIRTKVQAGNLAPVLRAYEEDLRTPFIGTFRGELIRTLLIQVQKTKVDLEIALSGIDVLLKSQELVFGFMGLTPGVLVCFSIIRYLKRVMSKRRGMKQGHQAGSLVRLLRNIDRTLAVAPVKNGMISYKDYGLLLCEVQTLQKQAHNILPGAIEKEFLEDVRDLCDIDSGLRAQLKALKRIRWCYRRWLR